LPCTNTKAWES